MQLRFVSLAFCSLTLIASGAAAATLQVPAEFASIQGAVDAAAAGDVISVAAGSYCGAHVSKQVELRGADGAIIIGCEAYVIGAMRYGFLLDGEASGSAIRGFTFDGVGVSNANLTPLALGIIARQVDDIFVGSNEILGTTQGITNTGGSGWYVVFNRIEGLSAFTCDGLCANGVGIVFQQRNPEAPRARGNVAAFNRIEGTIPDGLNEFSMVGVSIIAQEAPIVSANVIAIPNNDAAAGDGVGIMVSDTCCGLTVPFATTIDAVYTLNDGRRSEYVLQIDRDFTGGTGNSEGARIFGNRGVLLINDEIIRDRGWRFRTY